MKRFYLKLVLPVVAAGLALGIWAAVTTSSIAATSTANLSVSATVVAECTMSAASLVFGTYTGTSAVSTSTVIDVTCNSASTAWAIGGDAGLSPVGCARRMTDGTNFLGYNLAVNSLGSLSLGSNDGGVCDNGNNLSGAGSAADPTLFGSIPGPQPAPPPGIYSDTVVMTISF